MLQQITISNFDMSFLSDFWWKKWFFPLFFEFLVIFSNMSVIYAYNFISTLIWHRPKIADRSEISGTPRVSQIMKKQCYHDCFMQQHLWVSYAKNWWSDRNFWHSARLKSATFIEGSKNIRIFNKFMKILLFFSLSERRAGW